MRKIFSLFAALTLCAGLFAKTSVITYTAEEKLTEVTGKYDGGLHLNAFYAADSTQLTATHTFDQGTGTITLNGELAIIGDDAFYTCTSLQSITIPEGVTTIGVEAFYGCQSLQSITLPAGLTTIGEYAFYSCLSLESVNMPASVTTIGQRAFYYCVALQSLILPENLTKIEMMTFVSTGLTSITIPAGVTEIGMGAFAECADLTSVTFLGNACQNNIGEMAFYNVGNPDPALLTLPNSWTGTKPDEDGNWYGGKFEMSSDPTGWVNVNVNADVNKYLYNGQLFIRKGDKLYNAVGAEL